jgi:DNA-binding NarL/FixJ family response regulator
VPHYATSTPAPPPHRLRAGEATAIVGFPLPSEQGRGQKADRAISPHTPIDWPALEAEALDVPAQGRTNAEVAGQLVVSPGTVKVHVEHIIAKLSVADRTQAAVRAVDLGLLPIMPH